MKILILGQNFDFDPNKNDKILWRTLRGKLGPVKWKCAPEPDCPKTKRECHKYQYIDDKIGIIPMSQCYKWVNSLRHPKKRNNHTKRNRKPNKIRNQKDAVFRWTYVVYRIAFCHIIFRSFWSPWNSLTPLFQKRCLWNLFLRPFRVLFHWIQLLVPPAIISDIGRENSYIWTFFDV